MNDKQNKLNHVLEIVVDCCSYDLGDGRTVTAEQVLGPARSENVVWTRSMLAKQLMLMGFSTETISMFLRKTAPAVRNMIKTATQLHDTSMAYRIAEAQVTLRCRDIFAGI